MTMTSPSEQRLFDFDGDTYDHRYDRVRLNRQLTKVYLVVSDGEWRTLGRIAEESSQPEASVSARLRDLRKKRFGNHTVERRRLGDTGLWQYRFLPNNDAKLDLTLE